MPPGDQFLAAFRLDVRGGLIGLLVFFQCFLFVGAQVIFLRINFLETVSAGYGFH